jgi:16S rRNA (guanine527-N7)-methyltransferase
MNVPKWLDTDVSRETFERLEAYVALVQKWNPRINLVSKISLDDIWDRHIWDSAQVYSVRPVSGLWADFGSGGGLPAIVLSIFAKQHQPNALVHMVESDQRKCAFLRTAVRELELNAKVSAERIESLSALNANVVSARALTELSGLLAFAEQHCAKDGVAVFQKGATWQKELAQAQENWSFEYEAHNSQTNPDAVILKIREIARV